jgi:uncharacterized protein (DUF1778 family)
MLVFGPRRGRRPRAEAPSSPLLTRLSPAERDRVKLAAAANNQSVSEFMRDALVTAAEDCLESNS